MLLLVVFFLAVLHRRKRSNKTVTPGRLEGNGNNTKEDDRSSRAQSAENNTWDSETGWRKSFTAVRAKSANAILFTSPFCAPVKDQESLQTQSKDAENQDEGEQKLGDESEVKGGIQTENGTNSTDVIKHAKQSDAGRNLDGNPTNTDTVPYLSIGTNQNKAGPDGCNKGQRSQAGRVMGRVSTWPPTAVQWQARCKIKEEEEEEEGSDVLTVWTRKFPDEVKKEEHPSDSDEDRKEELNETNYVENSLKMTESHMKSGLSQSSKPNDKTTSSSEAVSHTDTGPEEQLEKEMSQNLKISSAHKKSSKKAEQRDGAKRAVASRQRPENRSSKAPSGGASPDDETLLSGNEYAVMGLLHEVVQNNGRWTRERWRQNHANKQRHQDRGTERV
ncbi:uncharacterized protein LOC131974380 [Centropristis striata]|uniref:uncharacterized protein LOC131974380 n=1 Tax=Centropristis striata TaxID=184440 RepID=UPI0027E1BF64|nr:uncharacterized protein LOC131974380 [Centropristis striata]